MTEPLMCKAPTSLLGRDPGKPSAGSRGRAGSCTWVWPGAALVYWCFGAFALPSLQEEAPGAVSFQSLPGESQSSACGGSFGCNSSASTKPFDPFIKAPAAFVLGQVKLQ